MLELYQVAAFLHWFFLHVDEFLIQMEAYYSDS